MTLYELIETPQLEDPVLVLAVEGWIDAGLAAAGVARLLEERLDTLTVARFSTDELLDYRARRPIAHLVDGVLRGLSWPSIELRAAVDDAGNGWSCPPSPTGSGTGSPTRHRPAPTTGSACGRPRCPAVRHTDRPASRARPPRHTRRAAALLRGRSTSRRHPGGDRAGVPRPGHPSVGQAQIPLPAGADAVPGGSLRRRGR